MAPPAAANPTEFGRVGLVGAAVVVTADPRGTSGEGAVFSVLGRASVPESGLTAVVMVPPCNPKLGAAPPIPARACPPSAAPARWVTRWPVGWVGAGPRPWWAAPRVPVSPAAAKWVELVGAARPLTSAACVAWDLATGRLGAAPGFRPTVRSSLPSWFARDRDAKAPRPAAPTSTVPACSLDSRRSSPSVGLSRGLGRTTGRRARLLGWLVGAGPTIRAKNEGAASRLMRILRERGARPERNQTRIWMRRRMRQGPGKAERCEAIQRRHARVRSSSSHECIGSWMVRTRAKPIEFWQSLRMTEPMWSASGSSRLAELGRSAIRRAINQREPQRQPTGNTPASTPAPVSLVVKSSSLASGVVEAMGTLRLVSHRKRITLG